MMVSKVNRIMLIGFRGAGKSTVGKLLARKLGWQYISSDDEIEKRENAVISDIVKENGWDYFRKLEMEIVKEFHDLREVVLDTGGGLVENEGMTQALIHASLVVWIDADTEDIFQRLQDDRNRPLLNQNNLREDIEVNYQRRIAYYQRYAHFRFNTSSESVEEICHKIISEMRQK